MVHRVNPPQPAAVDAKTALPGGVHRGGGPSSVAVGLGAFALVNLSLALLMAVGPHAFYTAVGPFGTFNPHYIRDVSTFYAAIGLAMLVAIRRPSWRVPVLAMATLQYGFHSLNHLLDVTKAHPAWLGWFDLLSLAAATGMLAWLWRGAARKERAARAVPVSPATPEGAR
jgi:hypothetical protein